MCRSRCRRPLALLLLFAVDGVCLAVEQAEDKQLIGRLSAAIRAEASC